MAKIVSEEANLHYLEADSTQFQVIRNKKLHIRQKKAYFNLIYLIE